MWSKLHNVFTVVVVLAAVAVAVSTVHNSFFAKSGVVNVDGGPPTYVPDWKTALPISTALGGNPKAPVTVMVFADLECPFCSSFHASLNRVLADHPDEVRAVFVHYPLSYHRFAVPAARAAECARGEGAFAEWVDTVYARQDSLGLVTWARLAAMAGVADTARIQQCAMDTRPVPNIEMGLKLGKSLGVTGTPKVFIDGWRYATPPSEKELASAIAALLRGDRPG